MNTNDKIRKQIDNSCESLYVAFPVKASQEQVIEHLFLLVRTRRGGGTTPTSVNPRSSSSSFLEGLQVTQVHLNFL